jgi:glycine oxidase
MRRTEISDVPRSRRAGRPNGPGRVADPQERYHAGMRHEWDAIVVGAGIIGLAIGRELARRGARTAILEERTVASGATQASAGVLAPYIEAPSEGALHELTVRSLLLYDRFIADLQNDSGRLVEYQRSGTLEVATSAESADRLGELRAALRADGVAADWMDGAAAARLEPALGQFRGALLVGTHGYVRVAQLTAALLDAARAHGAAALEGCRVEQIVPEPGAGLTVSAGGDLHHAATVVIAAGSWSRHVGAGAPPVRPVRGQLLELQWKGPPIGRVLWSDLCYVVPWKDGTVLVGATVEDAGFDQRTTVGGVGGLMEAACRLMPAAGDATFVAARAGLRPSTADGLPFIGRAPAHPGLVYATGHYRNGVLLAPLTADLVADLVIADRTDPALALTAPGR